MRQSRQFWALSLALVVLALELGAQPALAAKDQTSAAAGKTRAAKPKVPKIKRTIRVKEAVPAPQVVAPVAEPTGQNVEMKNEGSTNKVDVQPNISITAPSSPPNQPMQVVPYQPKQVEPIVEEPEEDGDGEKVPQANSGNENKLALVNSNNNLELATLGSNNRHAHTMGNSNNQLLELAEGNNNHKQTVMRNSGNTEQVHIDGVGNHKVTRISNAGNTEALEQQQQPVVRPQVVSAPAPALQTIVPTGNSPLVQINMNDVLDRVRSPALEKPTTTLIQPVVYGLPQVAASGPAQLPLVSSGVPFEALSARQQQAAEIASSQTGLISPSSSGRQMAPSPYNFLSALQQQQPMVMVMPPQQQQQQLLASPYGPAPMMMMPMFYPYQTLMVMAPQVPFDDYHRDHHVRRLDRKLHKLRIEDKIRRAERRARRKARREYKARAKEQENRTTPKPTVIVVNTNEHHKPSTTPAPVVTTPAPKVVVVTKEVTKEPIAKKVAVVKEEEEPKGEDEDEEEEEVIEWETVRVPKRRMKSKKSGASTSTK